MYRVNAIFLYLHAVGQYRKGDLVEHKKIKQYHNFKILVDEKEIERVEQEIEEEEAEEAEEAQQQEVERQEQPAEQPEQQAQPQEQQPQQQEEHLGQTSGARNKKGKKVDNLKKPIAP